MRASRLLLSAAFAAALPSLAWGACEVQVAPSKDVSDYLANAERVMAQVRLASLASNCGFAGTGALQGIFSQSAQELMSFGGGIAQSVNGVADFSTFKTTYEFYIGMPILQSDAPEYLYRDNELLEKQQKKIDDLGKYAANRCASKATVQPVKLKDGTSYPPAGTTVRQTLGQLTKTNGDVVNYFRGVAVGFEQIGAKTRLDDASQRPIFPRKGTDGIYKAYGTDRDVCRSGDGDFSRIGKALYDVAKAFSDTKGATKYWAQARKLMSGMVSGDRDAAYEKAERELLKKELARQGIHSGAAEQMLKNLDDVNAKNQGLTGFLASIGDRVVGTVKAFGTSLQMTAKHYANAVSRLTGNGEAFKEDGGGETISVALDAKMFADATSQMKIVSAATFASTTEGQIRAEALAMDLAKNYYAASLVSKDADGTAQEATRILGTSHRDLQGAIKRMEDTMKDATKLCNSQGSNNVETRPICNAKAPAK